MSKLKVGGASDAPGELEIERKFLLRSVPQMPPHDEIWNIEQGYFAEGGRLRRTVMPDGSIVCTHVIKKGQGLVRIERERQISPDEFDREWPRTNGRRLSKIRHRIREGEVVWEIDAFKGIELVLAEVELPSADAAVAIPAWLEPFIEREVTDDPRYTNSSIAIQWMAKMVNRDEQV